MLLKPQRGACIMSRAHSLIVMLLLLDFLLLFAKGDVKDRHDDCRDRILFDRTLEDKTRARHEICLQKTSRDFEDMLRDTNNVEIRNEADATFSRIVADMNRISSRGENTGNDHDDEEFRRKAMEKMRRKLSDFERCTTPSCTGLNGALYQCDPYGWFGKEESWTLGYSSFQRVNASKICEENGWSGAIDMFGGNSNRPCRNVTNGGGNCETGSDICGYTVDFHCASSDKFFSALIDERVPAPQHSIRYGTSTTAIMDGGNGMYDIGNYLRTSLCDAWPPGTGRRVNIPWNQYDKMTPVYDSCFGENGVYRVGKHDSSMVIVAKHTHTEPMYFRTYGNLGADNYGGSYGFTFSTALGDFPGGPYTGFVRAVCGYLSVPSVNHINVVDRTLSPGVYQSFSTLTNADGSKIHNVGVGSPWVFVLYSQQQGNCMTNAEHRVLFQETVAQLVKLHPPECAVIDIPASEPLTVSAEGPYYPDGEYCSSSTSLEHGTTCRLKCEPGFSGNSQGLYTCDLTSRATREPAALTHDCTENSCAEYFLSQGETVGGPNPCVVESNGAISLSTRSTTSCTLVCDVGFSMRQGGGDGCVLCDDRSSGWMQSTGKTCASWASTSGDFLASERCSNDASWVASKTCRRTCFNLGSGYDGDVCCTQSGSNFSWGQLSCPSNAYSGQLVDTSISCEENACEAIDPTPFGVVMVGTGCEDGAQLRPFRLPTQCTLRCDVGFAGVSVNSITLSCPSTLSNGDAPVSNVADPLTCQEKSCAPFVFASDETAGTHPDRCVEGLRLMTRSANMTECSYERNGIDMRARCPASAANNSQVQRYPASGLVQCAPYASFPSGVIAGTDEGRCYAGIVLDSTFNSNCTLKCAPGWVGDDGYLICPSTASGGDVPLESITCTPIFCSPLSLSQLVVGSDSVRASVPACTTGVELLAGKRCGIQCAPGYLSVGSRIVSCPLTASSGDRPDNSLMCVETSCRPIAFVDGIIPDTTISSPRACFDGEQLRSHTNSTCAIMCDETNGYKPLSSIVACPSNAVFGSEPTGLIESCEENRCAAIRLQDVETMGAHGTENGGCTEGERLGTHTRASCQLSCMQGWSGPGGTIVCSSTSADGDDPIITVHCNETFCDPLRLGDAYVGDSASSSSAATEPACYEGIVLSAAAGGSGGTANSSVSSCRVACAPGYTATSGQDTGIVSCDPADTSSIGAIERPTVSYGAFTCVENVCAPAYFPRGVVSFPTRDSRQCVDGIALTTRETTQCLVQCGQGYAYAVGNVECPRESHPGDAPVFNITCDPAPILRIGIECVTNGCSTNHWNHSDDFESALAQCDSVNHIHGDSVVRNPSTEGGDYLVFEGFQTQVTHEESVKYFVDINAQRLRDAVLSSRVAVRALCHHNLTSRTLRCPLPPGSGGDRSNMMTLARFRSDTHDPSGSYVTGRDFSDSGLLDMCYLAYARPRLDNIAGCNATHGCGREGGDRITVSGANFGHSEALLFIDGQICRHSYHIDSHGSRSPCDVANVFDAPPSCHQRLVCETPKMHFQLKQSSVMIVRDSLYSAPAQQTSGAFFEYEKCARGTTPSSIDVTRCDPCSQGTFSDDEDASFCVPCDAGTFAPRSGSTACSQCEANSYSDAGATACKDCPGGKMSAAGDGQCKDCGFIYSLPFLQVGHCEQPFLLYGLGIFVLVTGMILSWRIFKGYANRATEVHMLRKSLRARHDDMKLLGEAWMISWNELELHKMIAQGAGGCVFRGTLRNRYDVAVKFMSESCSIDDEKEIGFLKRCRHPRLVLFLGCGYRPSDHATFLVLEFCEKGTLEEFLYSGRDHSQGAEKPSWGSRLRLLADCAEGMSHLHLVLQALHRDLKSPNVLLSLEKKGGADNESVELRAKVADFGSLSRGKGEEESSKTSSDRSSRAASKKSGDRRSNGVTSPVGQGRRKRGSWVSLANLRKSSSNSVAADEVSEASMSSTNTTLVVDKDRASLNFDPKTMTAGIGSLLWMAPELHATLKQAFASYTPAVDTYSFGVIMYEALECVQPWSLEKYRFSYAIAEAVLAGKRPVVRSNGPAGYNELMNACWSQDPSDRPTFGVIYRSLEDMRLHVYAEESNRREKSTRPKSILRKRGSKILQGVLVAVSDRVSSEKKEKDADAQGDSDPYGL